MRGSEDLCRFTILSLNQEPFDAFPVTHLDEQQAVPWKKTCQFVPNAIIGLIAFAYGNLIRVDPGVSVAEFELEETSATFHNLGNLMETRFFRPIKITDPDVALASTVL
jgi:hypothetical protein